VSKRLLPTTSMASRVLSFPSPVNNTNDSDDTQEMLITPASVSKSKRSNGNGQLILAKNNKKHKKIDMVNNSSISEISEQGCCDSCVCSFSVDTLLFCGNRSSTSDSRHALYSPVESHQDTLEGR
jgi:hypothetical protein